MEDLLKIVISNDGEEILVHKSTENPLIVLLFPEYKSNEVIPSNSIRFKKNLKNYDSREIWKSKSRREQENK